jgi:hypothetical protein
MGTPVWGCEELWRLGSEPPSLVTSYRAVRQVVETGRIVGGGKCRQKEKPAWLRGCDDQSTDRLVVVAQRARQWSSKDPFMNLAMPLKPMLISS